MVYHIFPNTSGKEMRQALATLSGQRNNICTAHLAEAKYSCLHRIFVVLNNLVQTFKRIWFPCAFQKAENSFFNFASASKIARKVHIEHLHINPQGIKHFLRTLVGTYGIL